MRVRLKGINKVTHTLADGQRVTYYYAWKGGPRLTGEPGTPEFIASFEEAARRQRKRHAGTLQAVLNDYQEATEFARLAPRTKGDYVRLITEIERQFSDFPIEALADRAARSEFLAWRDRYAKRSPRQADYAFTVLARVLSWALDRNLVPDNPCKSAGRTYRATRADKVWTEHDEAAFRRAASPALALAMTLALWTGQRQGDLLRLTWNAYDGQRIRLRQSKTGIRVTVPVGAPLKAALDATTKTALTILTNGDGEPWTADGFRSSWAKAAKRAGIEGLTFHDLRGTAVTRLALAGATETEIATLTGHSIRDTRSILDAHYLNRDSRLAESAVAKLETRTNFPNGRPNGRSE